MCDLLCVLRRAVMPQGLGISDLAVEASKKALNQAGVDGKDIDLVSVHGTRPEA